MNSNGLFPNNNDCTVDDLTEKYCVKCFIDIPIRGKHCKICKTCISTFDHHCVWLGNCIGENNKKYFVLFLFFQCFEIVEAILIVKNYYVLVVKNLEMN